MIECPLCHEKFKSLNTHIFYKHKLSIDDFKKLYPDHPLQINKGWGLAEECPYCQDGKLFKHPGLEVHIAYKHKGIIRKDPKNKNKHEIIPEEGYICPICNKKKKNLSQHIEISHKILWDDFVKQYNWTEGKTFFSKKHKLNLSINKKKFYNETVEGAELKKIQSIKYSGDNNVAKRKDVREKISKSAINNLKKHNDLITDYTPYTFGIRVKYKGILYKSLNEFYAVLFFEKYDINFSYETKVVVYQDENNITRHYLIDFIVDNYAVEIKEAYTSINYEQQLKYKIAKEILEKEGLSFFICDFVNLADLFNKPRILPLEFKNICRKLIQESGVIFQKSSKHNNYAFFKELDNNYQNNPNFICR